MKRGWFVVLAVAALTLGGWQVGKADVTGLFVIDLTLTPQTNSQESVPFFFDLQSNLQVHITISGMIFGFDMGFGITGVEFAILSVGANLGALSIQDTFVFAPPFGCSAPSWVGVVGGFSDDTDGGIAGQCLGGFVTPVGSTDGMVNEAAIAFVKKRVDLQLDIAGISFGLLALFEDVDFPDIEGATSAAQIGNPGGSDHEHDHFRNTDLYFVGQHDAEVDNQTPSFGFGAVLTVVGQTISGITVAAITGICADNMKLNRIKKRKFTGEVNKGCVSENGPLFAFDVEKLHVEGLEIGGVSFSTWITFRPLQPVSAALEVGFSLAGLADIKAKFSSANIASLMIDTITVNLTAGNFSLFLEDLDANLAFDRATAKTSLTLNPNQNPAGFFSTTVAEAGIGVTKQVLELRISRMGLTAAMATTFTQTGGDGLEWTRTSFTLSAKLNAVTISSNVIFANTGLESAKLALTLDF